MQPEQMRAARAALNWSLERLAEASGVHRNTLSNFETRKYMGEPEKLAAVKRTLEAAGVIFAEENGEAAGVRLRRFRVGDLVRFRPQTRVRFSYNIATNEVGKIVGVEPHPPATGPTYRIQVQFERALVPYVFRFEYELVQAAPYTAESLPPKCEDEIMMSNPKSIIDEFCTLCESVWIDHDLYRSLYKTDHTEIDRRRIFKLCNSIAPKFFDDLNRILIDNLILQFSKITDPAATGKNTNLTTNYVVEKIGWPDDVRQKLREINARLTAFRRYIEPARSKSVAHVDLSARFRRLEDLGKFPKDADRQFLQDLQAFIDIAYGHFHNGAPRPINPAMSTDTHQLIRALEKSVIFDGCPKCDDSERAVAILDYEDRSE